MYLPFKKSFDLKVN